MMYPEKILPHPNYKSIGCDLSAYYLMRLTNSSIQEELIDPETGRIAIHTICSPTERIDDFSTSLYGIYNQEHIRLQFTEQGQSKFMHYCKPDEVVAAPVFETEFTNDADRYFWCVQIKQLHGEVFDYTRGKDPFKATCYVMHTPMKWNFWHFSLRWHTGLQLLEELDGNEKKNVAKRIGHAIRVVISHFAFLGVPEAGVLPQSCYFKN